MRFCKEEGIYVYDYNFKQFIEKNLFYLFNFDSIVNLMYFKNIFYINDCFYFFINVCFSILLCFIFKYFRLYNFCK